VHKEKIGLGATTLELICQRHSIIVEPIKITAYSKAKKHTELHERALYVGSEMTAESEKVTEGDIVQYVNDETVTWKKIVVVADSLGRIEKAIGERMYTDFFLMIDEIDCFQLDSSFRESMEECLDIFKEFPPSERAMVSATALHFSDPVLAKEEKTTIRYDVPTTRTIDILFTPSKIKSVAVKRIVQLIEENGEDKVMIAYNSVMGCYDMANHLCKRYGIAREDIRILCSRKNEEKIGDYYTDLKAKTFPPK
jgi:hypothetical protein